MGQSKMLITQRKKLIFGGPQSSSELITASVACAIDPSVTESSTHFSFQNLVFWNLLEFSAEEITYKSLSPTF
jgi:hypothetical protein